jgi:hypothetical protein
MFNELEENSSGFPKLISSASSLKIDRTLSRRTRDD